MYQAVAQAQLREGVTSKDKNNRSKIKYIKKGHIPGGGAVAACAGSSQCVVLSLWLR